MKYNQQEINLKHLRDPKPGDYWQRGSTGMLAVLDVSDDEMVLCKKKYPVDKHHWSFDVREYVVIKRDLFEKHVAIKKDFFANVIPQMCVETAAEFKWKKKTSKIYS